MPKLPYSRAVDKTDLFAQSGASLILELGQYLLDVGGYGRTALQGSRRPSSERIEQTLAEFEGKLAEHFKRHPRAGMRRYLLTRSKRTPGKVDFRAAKAVGVLAAFHVFQETDSVGILRAASLCVPDGTPADILEMRRVIAALGVDEVVDVAEVRGLWIPAVRLSARVTQTLLGGAECMPILSNGSLAAVRRARDGQAGKRAETRACATGKDRPKDVPGFVASLPHLTPRELSSLVEMRGFVGQTRALRTLCLAAYRHVNRLRRIYVEGEAPEGIPPRENVLVRGPTGCGKSLLARTLFGDVLSLPFALVDVTGFSETGYVGGDVSSIPCSLVSAAGSLALSEIGVLALDEIDKIADASGGERQMVSRHGVQRQLLLLLQGGTLEVPDDASVHPMRASRVPWRSHNVLFIGLGAFADWDRLCGNRTAIGFLSGKGDAGTDSTAETAGTDVFHRYGLMPELVARMPVVVGFQPLSREELREILERNTISAYRRELEMDGIALAVEPAVVELLVGRSLARKAGARGLQAAMVEALEGACYEAYSSSGRDRQVRLYAEGGSILWEITKARPRRPRTVDAGRVLLPEDLESFA